MKTTLKYTYFDTGDYLQKRIHTSSGNITTNRYDKYLCSYLRDFDSKIVTKWAIDGLSRIQLGLSDYEDISSNHFDAIATKDEVTIHFSLTDNNNPNWPIETFPIAEVKAALEGWGKFLEMPESFDSVVEVYI